MLPLSDMLRARSFPFVNVALIVANFIVFIAYELPNSESAVDRWSFYPCAVDNACHAPEPWLVSWFTAMFLHGGWDHILGNMLFLAIFGKNVEDAYGHLRYLALYVVGGFVAMMTQTLMTLVAGSASDATVPNLGASGAIAAVLGAYLVLYPKSQILTWVVVWVVTIPAWVFLGGWFVYQLVEANAGLFSPGSNGGGVAFFAHVGGFAFGAVVTWLAVRVGWVQPQDYEAAEATGRRPARTLWSQA
jgi:membrane associated rhomboid family serine protease